MLSIKSKNTNLEYQFPTQWRDRQIGAKGHPLFHQIELVLTSLHQDFNPELRQYDFSKADATQIVENVLAGSITRPKFLVDTTPPPSTFPFNTEYLATAITAFDDTTEQIWESILKLAHVASKGEFSFINNGL